MADKDRAAEIYLEVGIPRHQDAPLFVCPVDNDLDQGF